MKFKLVVANTKTVFKIDIETLTGEKVHSCGWYGTEFEYQDKRYAVLGPYNSLPGKEGKFAVYELVRVSELT